MLIVLRVRSNIEKDGVIRGFGVFLLRPIFRTLAASDQIAAGRPLLLLGRCGIEQVRIQGTRPWGTAEEQSRCRFFPAKCLILSLETWDALVLHVDPPHQPKRDEQR